MVKHVLPVGVRGIVVAGLLAALMSSLAGVFNASLDPVHDGPVPEVQAEAPRRPSWSGSAAWRPQRWS